VRVEFLRGRDKKDVLSVTRADGSTSWQHQHPGIPVHDLTHYAVETVLGVKNGFYGLLAQGWDITSLVDKDVRSVLPEEGIWTEFVVGLVQTERLSPEPLGSEEFNQLLNQSKQEFGITHKRMVTDDELQRIRRKFDELYSKWKGIGPGERLVFEF
jgi:hypothetical protein